MEKIKQYENMPTTKRERRRADSKLHGTIQRCEGWIIIKVDGHDRTRYLWYSKRDALKKYRQDNGLVGKHIVFMEF